MRLLGILVGSATAIVLLLGAIGVPEIRDRDGSALQHSPPSNVSDSVKLTTDSAPAPAQQPVVVEAPEPPADTTPREPATAVGESTLDEVQPPVATELPAAEQRWYAFWSPFRTELAAQGFVAELQRTTGLDYRVVKQKAGVYEVAFAYQDDEDAAAKLQAIRGATGLELPGG